MTSAPDRQVRLATELIYLGQAALVRDADQLLNEQGLGRAHFRALYTLARRPGVTVRELAGLLRVSTQALARVMTDLLRGGYAVQQDDVRDRRRRRVHLTTRGAELERAAYAAQADALSAALAEVGPDAAAGFLRALHALLSPEDRALLSFRLEDLL